MAINKNFVVKNGIEVNTNLIVADTDSNKVGIGTTVPEYTLHVFEGAGIGVTNITVTGISTNLEELNVGVGGTTLTAISNATLGIGGSVGVGTDAPGYLLEVHSPVTSGQTALYVRGDMVVTGDINIDDISIGDLNVSGISTFVGNILVGTGATVGFGSTAFFKDYAKAIFGDGEDLKVYHDGSNSYISDTGTGGLIVGSNSLTIKNAALNETQAVFTENGAVELYYDNGKRFETNAIGVEVSGTLESTGITTLASSGGITTTGGDLYVGGDLYINEDIVLDTNLEILGIATIGSIHVTGISTFDGTINGPNLTNSVVVGTGLSVHGSATGVAVTLAGAGGITTTGGDFYVGGDLYISEDVVLDTNLNILGIATIGSLQISGTSGINTISSTVQSTSKDTGSLVLQGGLGIEKQLYVGAGASVGAGLTVAGNLLPEADGTRDLGSSGAEWKDLYIDGTANIDSLSADTAAIGDLTNNRVVIVGTSGELEDDANFTFDGSTLGVTGDFTLTDTDAGSAAGPELKLYRNSASPADSDYLGQIKFAGESDTGAERNYAKITGKIKDASNGTEDGIIEIAHIKAGSQNISARWNSETLQLLNETQISIAGTTTIGTGIGVTTILDEDDMASDSATALASQQSIKAYVDTQLTAEDLDFGGDSGTGSVDLDSQTFTIAGTANEIETSASSQTLTIGLPDFVTVSNGLNVTGNGSTTTTLNVSGISTFSEDILIGTAATVGFGSTAFFRDDAKAIFGDGEDLQIYHDGSDSYITDVGTGDLVIKGANLTLNSDIVNINNAANTENLIRAFADGAVNLYYDNSKKFETGPAGTITVGVGTFDGLSLGDNEKALFGTGDDLQIYHDGSNSSIHNDVGAIIIENDAANSSAIFIKAKAGEHSIIANHNGGVELYHDNIQTFETTSSGILLKGPEAGAVILEMYADEGDDNADKFRFNVGDGGPFKLQNHAAGSWETNIECNGNGNVELYHDNSKKLETTADGVDFDGTGSIKVPVGTTGERPTGQAGDFRYNSTTGSFEGYTDEWGAIAGGGGASETDTSVSSTSATSIYTTPHATNRSVSAIIQITQGTSYQVGRYLVIHDGTTATIVEESAVATGDMLGSFTADINGSNLRILVNMDSASSATVTIIPTVVTV